MKTMVHWFRKDLRIHDNPAMYEVFLRGQTTKPEPMHIRPIFILDPDLLKFMNVGANRWRFLQQSLVDLDKQLKSINSRLYVIRGKPETVFRRLLNEWNVVFLTFGEDIEPYAKIRDAKVVKMAEEMNMEVKSYWSHTVYNPELIIQKNLGKPPLKYKKFLDLAENCKVDFLMGIPGESDAAPSPPDSFEISNPNCYDVPTLNELVENVDELGPCKFPGGETEGLNRLDVVLKNTRYVVNFSKPDTSPNSIEPSTTALSPYLKFGCLSSRLFNKRLQEILHSNPKHTKPPTSLLGQLMWREFYYTVAAGIPNFDKMVGNSICLQIPWQHNPEHLEAWTMGRTGYPYIDAIMRQLRSEGWIHHLARHSVACFLTRGDLWISWEEGKKVFEELLIDADWALNAGNWMGLSASAFFYQYFRVYSPVAFGKKTDPTGVYVRKYVPELAEYPDDCIYEPWKASLSSQKEYGCIIGKDYPERIVIHEVVSAKNKKKMFAAYKANRNGNAAAGKSVDKNVENTSSSRTHKRPADHNESTTTMSIKKRKN